MTQEFKFKFQIGKAPSTLIATIGPNGNAPDAWTGKKVEIEIPDTTDIPDCIELVKNVPPVDSPLLPVPEGLARCPVCNEYKGVVALRDVPDPRGLNQDENPDTPLRMQCICDGILCPRCQINKFHRPISNVWNERGGFGHIPYFRAWFPCDECNAKKQAEYAAANAEKRRKRGSR
jgi:hypothetical protein